MKLITTLVLTACVAFLAGCSSTPKKVDTGSIQASTFRFVELKGKPLPAYAEKERQAHTLVQNAITESLAARNIQRVEQGGDLTVAYLIIVGNGAVTTSIDDYFGYGRDSSKLMGKAHSAYGKSQNPDYCEAGTLLVDIIDSQSFKLLKRGYATRMLQANLPVDQRATRTKEAVEEILRDVKFEH